MPYPSTMISSFLLFFALLSSSCSKHHKPIVEKGSDIIVKVYTLSGKIAHTRSYCAGIAPPPGALDKQKIPQPYANRTLFVKQGTGDWASKAIFHKFSTDENGNFSVELPQGDYGIFIESKIAEYDNKYAQGQGKDSCAKWRSKPDITWKIEKNAKNQSFSFHTYCNPCHEPAR